jgi:serine/threonine-protein kinase
VTAANDLAQEAEARIGAMLLGKWRIERLIGVGGMGAVYEAHHRNQSRVAVKVLHRRATLSKAQLARFKREGYAANHVGHPGVVEVFDDDVDEQGSPFLVMELLDGKTVAQLAKDHGGKLPVDMALDVADRLLDVLAAAHAKGILHRDIKPENLFITTSGDLKVLDFGIARIVEPGTGGLSTIDGTLLGTPAFSPPEQARGRLGEMDERSDVWAVGATLFNLLTGQLVHAAETTNEQLGLAMSVAAPSLASIDPTLPAPLVALVDRALAYERHDRWPSAQAMRDAVQWIRTAPAAESARIPEEWGNWVATTERGSGTLGSKPSKHSTRGFDPSLRRGVVFAVAAGVVIAVGVPLAGSLRTVNAGVPAPRPIVREAPRREPAPPVLVAAQPTVAEPIHARQESAETAPRLVGVLRRASVGKRAVTPVPIAAPALAAAPAPVVAPAPVAAPAPAANSETPASRNVFDRRH